MPEYTFRRWAEGGDDVEFTAEVTDSEFELLRRLEKECEPFDAVYDEDEDLYFRILTEAAEETRAELIECGEDPDHCNYGLDFLGEFDYEPGED